MLIKRHHNKAVFKAYAENFVHFSAITMNIVEAIKQIIVHFVFIFVRVKSGRGTKKGRRKERNARVKERLH